MRKKDISEHYKKIGIMPEMSMLAFQAESVAYWVSQMLNLDTSDYSFGYISGWSKNREVSELKENLELIKSTADKISADLEKELTRSVKQEKDEAESAEKVMKEQEEKEQKAEYESEQVQVRRKKSR